MPKNNIKPGKELKQLVDIFKDYDDETILAQAEIFTSGNPITIETNEMLKKIVDLRTRGKAAQRPYERG